MALPVFMIQPARTDPTHAPRLLPTPISGKIRLPCSGVKMSLANAQNCAITITLKMPTQGWLRDPDAQPGLDRQHEQRDVGGEEERHPAN